MFKLIIWFCVFFMFMFVANSETSPIFKRIIQQIQQPFNHQLVNTNDCDDYDTFYDNEDIEVYFSHSPYEAYYFDPHEEVVFCIENVKDCSESEHSVKGRANEVRPGMIISQIGKVDFVV